MSLKVGQKLQHESIKSFYIKIRSRLFMKSDTIKKIMINRMVFV